MNCLSPSILSADFSRLGEQLQALDRAGAQYVHIDVMDGFFVPQITYGMPVIRSIRPCTERIFDVHLMIDDPIRYIDDFADAGADLISVHAEACLQLERTVHAIKERGVLASVAVSPGTPLSVVEPLLQELDMVLIMGIQPGFGGQPFIPEMLEKIREMRRIIMNQGYPTDIEVDGGVKVSNVRDILNAGANIIVAGSAIFQGDVEENTRRFLQIMEEA